MLCRTLDQDAAVPRSFTFVVAESARNAGQQGAKSHPNDRIKCIRKRHRSLIELRALRKEIAVGTCSMSPEQLQDSTRGVLGSRDAQGVSRVEIREVRECLDHISAPCRLRQKIKPPLLLCRYEECPDQGLLVIWLPFLTHLGLVGITVTLSGARSASAQACG